MLELGRRLYSDLIWTLSYVHVLRKVRDSDMVSSKSIPSCCDPGDYDDDLVPRMR